MAETEYMMDIDQKLELLNYGVEDILGDFMNALDKVSAERNWTYTMSSVRRIATCGVRAFARVYAREAGETFRYVGLMRYLLVEAVRRKLQCHVNPGEERMMWIKLLARLRDMEKQIMKDTELATENLWQPFEIEALKNLVLKMDQFNDKGCGTSWRDNLAAQEVELPTCPARETL